MRKQLEIYFIFFFRSFHWTLTKCTGHFIHSQPRQYNGYSVLFRKLNAFACEWKCWNSTKICDVTRVFIVKARGPACNKYEMNIMWAQSFFIIYSFQEKLKHNRTSFIFWNKLKVSLMNRDDDFFFQSSEFCAQKFHWTSFALNGLEDKDSI